MASQFTLKWNGPRITADLRQAADRGVFKAANLFRNEVVRLILRTKKSGRLYGEHRASAPGESPASDTGRLVNSVRIVHRPGTASAIVGVAANYAKLLEFGGRNIAARPFFRPAYAAKREQMIAVIGNEVSRAMRNG